MTRDVEDVLIARLRQSLAERLWIITQADGSVTTILRPEDY